MWLKLYNYLLAGLFSSPAFAAFTTASIISSSALRVVSGMLGSPLIMARFPCSVTIGIATWPANPVGAANECFAPLSQNAVGQSEYVQWSGSSQYFGALIVDLSRYTALAPCRIHAVWRSSHVLRRLYLRVACFCPAPVHPNSATLRSCVFQVRRAV